MGADGLFTPLLRCRGRLGGNYGEKRRLGADPFHSAASGERAAGVPEDTAKAPLEMWVKGYLVSDAAMGDNAEVITRTGRRSSGVLVDEAPYFDHGFGVLIPEVLKISDMVREITFGGGCDE